METPRRIEHRRTDRGVVPVYATAVVDQPWSTYSREDHEVWATLVRRQSELLPRRACRAFLDASARFGMCPDRIPKFSDLNRVLRRETAWELVGVEGLLPDSAFFDHLANRRFPVTWWIRGPAQLDYISEPDLFHDLYGHLPLLADPVFADFMQAYGCEALKATAIGPHALTNLARLYWYTVEFGLVRTDEGLRIYGAGIVSSRGESIHCLESPAPNRLAFDLERVMRTQFAIDTRQSTYFVIDGFGTLFQSIQRDLRSLYARLEPLAAYPAETLLPSDIRHAASPTRSSAGPPLPR